MPPPTESQTKSPVLSNTPPSKKNSSPLPGMSSGQSKKSASPPLVTPSKKSENMPSPSITPSLKNFLPLGRSLRHQQSPAHNFASNSAVCYKMQKRNGENKGYVQSDLFHLMIKIAWRIPSDNLGMSIDQINSTFSSVFYHKRNLFKSLFWNKTQSLFCVSFRQIRSSLS